MRKIETAASTDKANVELTEQELNKVTGTGIYLKGADISGQVTTEEHVHWIDLSNFQSK